MRGAWLADAPIENMRRRALERREGGAEKGNAAEA